MNWIKLLSATSNWVGVEVPVTVQGIIVITLLVFFLSWWLFYTNVKKVSKGIQDGLKALALLSTPVQVASLEELKEKFSCIPTLCDAWEEFNESLVADRAPDGTHIAYNTSQAERFFNSGSVIDHYVNRGLYSSVPGVLTSIGLLGTFIALFFAMINLHVQDSGQVGGIEAFINNLSGKFISSIMGLFFALVFLIVERTSIGKLDGLCQTLQRRIDKLFAMKTQESLLLKIGMHLEEQSNSFKLFNADLSGHLKESFRESIEPTLERLIVAIGQLESATEEMKKQKEESASQVVGSMIEEFQKSLSGSATSEFSKLGSVLSETAEFTKGMNDRMESYLGHIDTMLVTQRDQNQNQSKSLTEAMSGLIDKLESSSTSQLTVVDQAVNKLFERSATWSDQMQKQFDEGSSKQSHALGEFIAKVQTSAEEHLQQTKASLSEIANTVSSSSDGVISNLKTLSDRIANDEAHIKELIPAINDSIRSFKEVIDSNRSLVGDMRTVSNAIESSATQLNKSAGLMSDSAIATKTILSQLSEGVSSQHASILEIKGLWDRQKELYDVLDQQLGNAVKTVNEALVDYSQSTSEHLETYLQEFDSHLSDACRKLGVTIDELGEQLGELTEVIDTSISRELVRSK